MKKFIALYMMSIASIDEMRKNSTPEQMKAGMDSWMKWQQAHQKDIVEMGTPTGRNKRVTAKGVSDTRNEVCGYSIVQAESQDAAAKIMSDSPHLQMPGTYIEIMECLPM